MIRQAALIFFKPFDLSLQFAPIMNIVMDVVLSQPAPLMCNLGGVGSAASLAAVAAPGLTVLLITHMAVFSSARLSTPFLTAARLMTAIATSAFHWSQNAFTRAAFLLSTLALALALSHSTLATAWKWLAAPPPPLPDALKMHAQRESKFTPLFALVAALVYVSIAVLLSAALATPLVAVSAVEASVRDQLSWLILEAATVCLAPTVVAVLVFNLAACHGLPSVAGDMSAAAIRCMNAGALLVGAAVGTLFLAQQPCNPAIANDSWKHQEMGMHAISIVLFAYGVHLLVCGFGFFKLRALGEHPAFRQSLSQSWCVRAFYASKSFSALLPAISCAQGATLDALCNCGPIEDDERAPPAASRSPPHPSDEADAVAEEHAIGMRASPHAPPQPATAPSSSSPPTTDTDDWSPWEAPPADRLFGGAAAASSATATTTATSSAGRARSPARRFLAVRLSRSTTRRPIRACSRRLRAPRRRRRTGTDDPMRRYSR